MPKLGMAAQDAKEKLGQLQRQVEVLEKREATLLIALSEAQESSTLLDIHMPHSFAHMSGKSSPDQVENDLIFDLAEVKAESASVRRSISEITNATAPVSALPAHILCEIFVLGMCSNSSIDVHKRPRFLFVVSHVMRSWRRVAVNTPSLWTAIDIWPWQSEDVVKIHLQRSKTFLLDITFTLVNFGAFFFPRYHPILIPHIHRWRRLLVISDVIGVLDKTLGLLHEARAPRFEHLELYCTAEGNMPDSNVLFAGGAPRFSSLSVYGINPLRWLPPQSSLTTLRVNDQNITLPQLRELLKATPCLTTLSFFAVHLSFPRAIRIEPVRLPGLRTVAICGSPKEKYVPNLLTILVATSLESLTLESFLCSGSEFVESLGFHPSVRTLKLVGIDLMDETIPCIVRAFPSVEHLNLENCIPDRVLRQLQGKVDVEGTASDIAGVADVLWPNMRKLIVPNTDSDVGCDEMQAWGSISSIQLDGVMINSMTYV
jgi:hypothetical protein